MIARRVARASYHGFGKLKTATRPSRTKTATGKNGHSAGRRGRSQREVAPATWRAFWLAAVDGLPPGEIAAQLGMKTGSVYAAKCRVLARIRERIRELSRERT